MPTSRPSWTNWTDARPWSSSTR